MKGGYFKHVSNARNNEGVVNIMQDLGYKGYFFWFALLEIYTEQFYRTNTEKCSFYKTYLLKELKCDHKNLAHSLNLCKKYFNLNYSFSGPMCDISIPKLLIDKSKSKSKTKLSISLDRCNAFIECWNETLGQYLGNAKVLNETRKKHISKTIKLYPEKEQWIECFRKVYQSDFLMGKKSDWKSNFDFICKEQNFTKAIEGIYDNNINKKDGPKLYSEMKKQNTDDAFMAVIKRRGLNE